MVVHGRRSAPHEALGKAAWRRGASRGPLRSSGVSQSREGALELSPEPGEEHRWYLW